MNERIRELVNQAISDVDYIRADDFTNEELSKMYIPDCFTEKFAELIVRECTDICEHWDKTVNYTSHGQIIADKIKKHFGVEL